MKTCSVCQQAVDDSIRDEEHEHEVTVRGRLFKYSLFYDRLQSDDESAGSIACVRCHGDSFRIGYGEWECIASCACGHSFTIYDG